MVVLRPYNAEDNELNTEMRRIVENYLKKNGEVIFSISIYEMAVNVITESGREIFVSKAMGCRARTYEKRNYFYMTEKINGKQKRIKKEEW